MGGNPRTLIQFFQYALLIVSTVVCFGCAGFARTPADPASRMYPSLASGCACAVDLAAPRHFGRVLIIVLENQDYKEAIADRYLGSLAKQGASFTNFHGLFHPSYSNYLAMVAGKEIPTYFDRQKDLNECTIADLLEAKGLTWKNYAEGYPEKSDQDGYHCFTGRALNRYARKHVPFMSFVPLQKRKCGNIVPATRLDEDLSNNALPTYALYSPDLDNDGHDTGLAYASQWLEGFLEPRRKNRAFMEDRLIVVTFDESGDQSQDAGNHIYTVFLGDMVKTKEVKENYNHYNVLRTIEENFGLCSLGDGDAGAKPITDVWK